MLLLFSIRVAKWPHVWVYFAHLSGCVCVFFYPFDSEDWMWNLNVLFPDNCLPFYFTSLFLYDMPKSMKFVTSHSVTRPANRKNRVFLFPCSVHYKFPEKGYIIDKTDEKDAGSLNFKPNLTIINKRFQLYLSSCRDLSSIFGKGP